MYHSKKSIHYTIYLLLIAFLLLPAKTESNPIQANETATGLSFPVLSYGKANKNKPLQMTLYQQDDTPLGKRTPLLFVHGLKAEYWPNIRWRILVKNLKASSEFCNKYKIFFVRYDSAAALDKMTAQLQIKIAELYNAAGQKPITILALSMGGNIVYSALLKPETDKQVKLFLAMATPFHGSPLFSADWLQYGMYKNVLCPLSRIDRSIAYRLYFSHKTNLLSSLSWDNCDQSVPDIGSFASLLPFGPRGDLTAASTTSQELVAANQKPFDKSKIIAYGGFLPNIYQSSAKTRLVVQTIMFPYNMLTITVPAHLGREHSVLKMLNVQISTVPTTQTAAKRADNIYVYDLNDGITPILSSLFLSDRYCQTESISHESDFTKIKPLLDVGIARVFRNIDHLTFIDGYKPLMKSSLMRDELNPQAGKRNIFSWILFDLDCAQPSTKQSTTVVTYN